MAPTRAPRCLGSAAIVISVSDDALNKKGLAFGSKESMNAHARGC